MFNKIALSWQMQYEMRWCIKQHSHLFYYTRDEEEICCGGITYLNHFLCTQSRQRGRWGRYPRGGQSRQASIRASVSKRLFGDFPMKNRQDCNTAIVMQPGCPCFKVVFLKAREKGEVCVPEITVAANPDHSQAHLTINQDSDGWLISQKGDEITETSFPATLYFPNHSNLRKLKFPNILFPPFNFFF